MLENSAFIIEAFLCLISLKRLMNESVIADSNDGARSVFDLVHDLEFVPFES